MINAYYNGMFMKAEDVKIPLGDRSIYFGDGVYDAAAGRNGKIYLEREHLGRFKRNAEALNISLSLSEEEISCVLHRLIEKSGLCEYFIYFHSARQSKERSHAYADGDVGNFLATIKPHRIPEQNKRLRLISAEDTRYYHCNLKTLNLLPNVMASKKASDAGCDEAVFIRGGLVTECSHSNIMIIKDNTLFTHPNGSLILPGIMRARILEKCEDLHIPVSETAFSKDELYSADEIIVSSTTKLCLSASEIDGIPKIKKENSPASSIISSLHREFYQMTEK
jgi:D-alanine transaminase